MFRPISLFRCVGVVLPVLCVFLSAPSRAHAATSDVVELESYTLTMAKVHHLAQALSDIGAYTKAHPEIRASLETESDQGETLDAAAARMASIPAIADILTRDELQPRDFVLTEFTFVQSAMAVASQPIDQGDMEYAARLHLNPANLAFVRDHRTELRAMQTRLGVSS